MRQADVRRQGLSFIHRVLRAGQVRRRRTFVNRLLAFRRLAPNTIDELAVVAIGKAVTGHVVPYVSRAWLIHIRLIFVERDFVGHTALKIVGALSASVADLPGLLVVIAGDGRSRPIMPITRNFSAVVEV